MPKRHWFAVLPMLSLIALAAGPAHADQESARRGLAAGIPKAELKRAIAAPSPTRGAADVYRDRVNGVVIVAGKNSIGTGALLDRSGTIVTNDHVAVAAHRDGGDEWLAIWFKPADGSMVDEDKFLTAKIVRKEPKRDLAIIKLVEPVPASATIVPLAAGNPEVGSDVFVIGHPKALFWSLTQGIISQVHRDYQWQAEDRIQRSATTIQTQAPINPGNSGGPLLNAKGEIIGIVSFGRADAQGLFFAIDVAHVREVLAMGAQTPQEKAKAPAPARKEPAAKAPPKGKGKDKEEEGISSRPSPR
jgi:S1-C subfamily serine protease